MDTKENLLDYQLPEELIAQTPAEPRDSARLMVIDRASGSIEHRKFFDIFDELHAGDVLVLNDTKVFKARLQATTGSRVCEVVLLRSLTPTGSPMAGGESHAWEAMLRPARKVKIGSELDFGGMIGTLREKSDDGTVRLAFDCDPSAVIAFANENGEVPLPPYIDHKIDSIDEYQTVYAENTGSVAAPTAGLHFTPELLERIRAKGVEIEHITLHVGLGTFQPIWEDRTIEEHKMHSEFVEIKSEVAQRINRAKQNGRRVIAVGTTTTRALEGACSASPPCEGGVSGGLLPDSGFAGDVDIFMKPGYDFQIIDALVTNFHLPRTTLLLLVASFAGPELMQTAYKTAIEEKYRFYSFGDAMMIK